ncbi:HMG domain-containing protein 3-like isoform X2 [Rhopilema esculentum]|uniref:HMG domain-containing protein 3-like isoform X2 n=1 Tax=Rhopilema esculentum TaxID=499914 RepID=UPI0031CEE31C
MKSMAIGEISDLDTESLIGIASSCKIRTQGKSKDMLRIQLQELYATILVGSSSCHGFTKSPGHTGGFYHIVCLHGTTVCSKFMILTESVRDAADLWLSLRYPPVLFICDTPCTFVRHMNLRDPDMARITWGENDGCFEKPKLEAIPTLKCCQISIYRETAVHWLVCKMQRRYGRKWIMIECSGDVANCPGSKWFHMECVGMSEKPPKSEDWFCVDCMRERQQRRPVAFRRKSH